MTAPVDSREKVTAGRAALELSVVRGDAPGHGAPLLAVGVHEGGAAAGAAGVIDAALGGLLADVVARGDFAGRDGQSLLVYPRSGAPAAERVLFIGLGDRAKASAEVFRRFAGTAAKQAGKLGVERVAVALPDDPGVTLAAGAVGQAVAEGLILGAFVFDEMKTQLRDDAKPKRLAAGEILVANAVADAVEAGAATGRVLADAENFARRLGNLPGNIATPSFLAETGRGIAEKYGMKAEILGRADLEREGMGALLAVSAGSEQEPFLIVLEHRKGPADQAPVALVGKGLTFDAGGISIKPAAGMEDMKFDMSGGAAVLAAMSAIGELDLPVNVVGLVPTSENLLSGEAMKPGDIVPSHLGKTIEVVNTDAEGRLILADALSWARRYNPSAIVDTATLTGAVLIALGEHASAILGNDDALIAEVTAAADRVHERVWPLPMYDEYREQIRSDYADIKNTGGRQAGTITAAWFLREFVGDTPWVHLDVAGTANGDGKLPYRSKGSTGVPTRLLVEWVRSRVR